jgi:sialic acid synthase SpsE
LGLKEEHTFTSSELEYRARMKKCLVAAVDLPAGHRLGASDVVLLRAAQPRLAPDQLFEWLGKSLTVSVTAGDPIAPEHFQGECR